MATLLRLSGSFRRDLDDGRGPGAQTYETLFSCLKSAKSIYKKEQCNLPLREMVDGRRVHAPLRVLHTRQTDSETF